MLTRSTAKRIAAAICSCILCAVFSFSSLASDYSTGPTSAKAFLHNHVSLYSSFPVSYNTQTQLYSVTVDTPISDYGTVGNYMFSLGSSFVPSTGFDQYATYQYTISLVPAASNRIDVSSPSEFGLFGFQTNSSGSPIVSEGVFVSSTPEITQSDNVYTFTFSGIPYSKIANSFLLCWESPFSNFTPYTTSINGVTHFEVYLMNIYFGLESEFDQETYDQAIADKLDDMNQHLDKVNDNLDKIDDSINDVGDKVDDAADQISGELDELQDDIKNQPQAEMDAAKGEADKASGDADAALNDSGLLPDTGSLLTGLSTIFDSIKSTATVSYIPIPEVALPSLTVGGSQTPSVTLIEEQNYDISQLLENEYIQKLIIAAKVLYYIFFCIFIVDYCRKLLAKIGLGDVNTNDNHVDKTSGRDPHASKTDPHNIKMR